MIICLIGDHGYIPDEPCVAFECEYYEYCGEYNLACRSFYRYVKYEWVQRPQRPTRKIYEKIYKDE